jgi:hypothetical protein
MTTPDPTPDPTTLDQASDQAARRNLDNVDDVLDRYLAAVATRLSQAAPARARQAILAELHDGLLEATDTQKTAAAVGALRPRSGRP